MISYLLRTSPATLLTPPDEQTALTGVPESYLSEEIEKWTHGELVLTSEGLLTYWQQEWVQNLNRIQHFESAVAATARAMQKNAVEQFTSRLAEA